MKSKLDGASGFEQRCREVWASDEAPVGPGPAAEGWEQFVSRGLNWWDFFETESLYRLLLPASLSLSLPPTLCPVPSLTLSPKNSEEVGLAACYSTLMCVHVCVFGVWHLKEVRYCIRTQWMRLQVPDHSSLYVSLRLLFGLFGGVTNGGVPHIHTVRPRHPFFFTQSLTKITALKTFPCAAIICLHWRVQAVIAQLRF